MKKLLSLLVIFNLSVWAIGCGGGAEQGTSGSGDTDASPAETPDLGDASADPAALSDDPAAATDDAEKSDDAAKDADAPAEDTAKDADASKKEGAAKKKPEETETIEDDKDSK